MAMAPLVPARGRRSLAARRALVALAVLAAVACAALALPAGAHAHASFTGASPAPGARVEQPPRRIVLHFSESLNRQLSSAKLFDAHSDARIPVQVARGAARDLVLVPREPLPRGAYRIEWHTVSTDDGHPLAGTLGFGVQMRAVAGQALEQSPFSDWAWARSLARIALYLTALLLVGALGVTALLDRRRRRSDGPWIAPRALDAEGHAAAARAARKRARSLVTDIGVAAFAAAAIAALADAAVAARGFDPVALREFLLGSFTGAARLLTIVALAAAAWLAPRRPVTAALAGVYALGFVATSGHANSAGARVVAILSDWVHLCAAAAWVGGMAFLLLVWAPGLRRGGAALRRSLARHVLPAFGRVALPAFVVVVLSGTLNGLVELSRVADLWATAYGRVLAAKLVLVAIVAWLSYLHALRLRPRVLAAAADAEPRRAAAAATTGAEPRRTAATATSEAAGAPRTASGSAGERPATRDERRMWAALRAEPLLAGAILVAVGLLVAFPLPPRQLADAGDALGATVPSCDPCPLASPRADELAVAGQAGTGTVAAWISQRPGSLDVTIRTLDVHAEPADIPVLVAGGRRTSACGLGCTRFAVAGAPPRLRVTIRQRGRAYGVALPARWQPGAARRARALLRRAERTMRALRSVREVEHARSSPTASATTRYVLQAPNRMRYSTDLGLVSIAVGHRQWQRIGDGPWHEGPYPGYLPFRTRSGFRWTPYAETVRLLGERRRRDGRRVARLALADTSTPVWIELDVDVASGHVLAEQDVGRARLLHTRYYGFDAPVTIVPPRSSVRDDGP